MSSADVKAVFDRASKVFVRLLQDGKSVDCGDMGTFRPSITTKTGTGVESAEKVGVELVDKAKVIYTPRVKIKTALKGVRLERAERFLDVPYKSSAKKKKDKPEGGGSTPVPGNGDGHVGI